VTWRTLCGLHDRTMLTIRAKRWRTASENVMCPFEWNASVWMTYIRLNEMHPLRKQFHCFSDLSQSILVKEKHWAENFVRDVTYVMRFVWPHDVDDSCKTLKDSEWECYVSVWMKCIRLNDVHPFEWNASVAKAVPLFSYSGCFASLSNRSSCAKQWLADSESVTEYSLMKG